MKKLILFLFISSLLYANNSNFQIAKKLFDNKQYKSAINILENLVENNLANEKYNFYLGRAYYELNQFEKASIHFERILIINENNLRARTELAQTYFKLGLDEDAKYNFSLVLQNNIPKNVKVNIQKQLKLIENKQKKHFFNALIGFGISYDDNINNVSDLTTFDTPLYTDIEITDKKQSDINYLTFINTHYMYKLNSKFNIRNSLRFAKQIFKDEKQKNLDLISYNFYLQHNMKNKNLIYELNFATIDLDKDKYLDTKGLGFKFIKKQNNNIYSYIGLNYYLKEYQQLEDKDLDSSNYQLKVGTHIATKTYGKLNLSYSYLNEKMKEDEVSNSDKTIHFLDIGNSYKINSKTYWLSNLLINYTSEKEDDSIFLKKRVEQLYTISTGISYNISKTLNITSNIKYIKNNSNINVYSYDKKSIDFFIKKSF